MHYVTTSFTRKKNNFVFEVNFFAARSTSTQQQQQNKIRYFRMRDQLENNNLTWFKRFKLAYACALRVQKSKQKLIRKIFPNCYCNLKRPTASSTGQIKSQHHTHHQSQQQLLTS